jgi:hypothetical protein
MSGPALPCIESGQSHNYGKIRKTGLIPFYAIDSELLIFNNLLDVQKEIEGILSPNNNWPNVYLSLWVQNIGSKLPIMLSQSPERSPVAGRSRSDLPH